jgi:hypothetical protein
MDDFDLDLQDVNARLVPGAHARELPKGWKPWKQPRPSLAIDDFLTKFATRQRAPMLRPPDDLVRHDMLGCPYAIARRGIALAALHAEIQANSNEHRTLANSALQAFSATAGAAREQLVELAGHLHKILAAQEHAFDPDIAELPLLSEHDRLLSAISALARLQQPTTQLYRQRSQRRGNVWRIEFVKSLFACWWRLTGSDPSREGPFCEFLDAALLSLTADPLPLGNWESAIKTAKSQAQRERGLEAPWRVNFAKTDDVAAALGGAP